MREIAAARRGPHQRGEIRPIGKRERLVVAQAPVGREVVQDGHRRASLTFFRFQARYTGTPSKTMTRPGQVVAGR